MCARREKQLWQLRGQRKGKKKRLSRCYFLCECVWKRQKRWEVWGESPKFLLFPDTAIFLFSVLISKGEDGVGRKAPFSSVVTYWWRRPYFLLWREEKEKLFFLPFRPRPPPFSINADVEKRPGNDDRGGSTDKRGTDGLTEGRGGFSSWRRRKGGGIRPTDGRPRRADERDIPDRLDENIVRTSCFGRGRPSHDITLLGRRTSTRTLFPPRVCKRGLANLPFSPSLPPFFGGVPESNFVGRS